MRATKAQRKQNSEMNEGGRGNWADTVKEKARSFYCPEQARGDASSLLDSGFVTQA
jgi:hypothetical protein